MTPQARNRRIGWIATLTICLVLYLLLHLKVTAMHSQVALAEDEIVRLEQRNMVLETEVLTRSSQIKLAAWNQVDFGYRAPEADQYITGERSLAALGGPRGSDAPAPIRLATITTGENAPAFPAISARREYTQVAKQAAARRRSQGDRVRIDISAPVELAER